MAMYRDITVRHNDLLSYYETFCFLFLQQDSTHICFQRSATTGRKQQQARKRRRGRRNYPPQMALDLC